MGVAEDHLPAPLGDWFVSLCEGNRSAFECQGHERKRLIQAQLRYLHHQMGGLREIKSYDVLEAVFCLSSRHEILAQYLHTAAP